MEDWSFEKEYGFPPPRIVGPYIGVVIHKHVLSESIVITDDIMDVQKWTSNVGRLFNVGSACYKGERFKDWEDLPKVGEWVVFKVNAGPLLKYRGIDISIMYDDAVKGIVKDPSYVTRD